MLIGKLNEDNKETRIKIQNEGGFNHCICVAFNAINIVFDLSENQAFYTLTKN